MFTFVHFFQGSSVLYSLIYAPDLLLQSAISNVSQMDHFGYIHVNVCQTEKKKNKESTFASISLSLCTASLQQTHMLQQR